MLYRIFINVAENELRRCEYLLPRASGSSSVLADVFLQACRILKKLEEKLVCHHSLRLLVSQNSVLGELLPERPAVMPPSRTIRLKSEVGVQTRAESSHDGISTCLSRSHESITHSSNAAVMWRSEVFADRLSSNSKMTSGVSSTTIDCPRTRKCIIGPAQAFSGQK